MAGFAWTAPARTLFGRGCSAVAADEIAALGARVLLVRGRSVAWVDALDAALQAQGCAVETVFGAGEPDLDAVRAAVSRARAFGAECVVAVGGGAVIDLGKALAGLVPSGGDPADYLELGPAPAQKMSAPLPFVAIPTTAGTGAEATRNAVIGVPERRAKISLRDPRLVPALAVVDPSLTDGAPRALTLACGLDAITQLVEPYLGIRANPITDALCRDALPEAIVALARLMDAEDPDARDAMARASHLSGLALANSGLGVVHGLASVIGGRGGAHGAICGRLLPAALIVNRAAVTRDGQDVARFDAVERWMTAGLGEDLRSFMDRHGLASLEALNMPRDAVGAVAEAARAASSTKGNPVTLSGPEIEEIVERSF